ncbi:SDR family NAD(P)-dependent oxidoreductase [Candidatus Bathyarchaeota archaeon]|nr:SDR family NAD(P)-dependent oxidoreductase [Candidatus Bathyarchaeota archaeon]
MKFPELKNRPVLVTGGAGFIGSHLVDRLVEEGAEVRVLDDLSRGRREYLEGSWERIEFIEGDIRRHGDVSKALTGIKTVFHLAANTSVPRSVEDPRYDFEVNAGGAFNLLDACRLGDVDEIVYASTAAVYGDPRYTPIDEAHPTDPISPYGASKLAGEKMGAVFHRVYDLSFTTVRIFNVYGPRQSMYVMYDFMVKLSKSPRRLEVLGDGGQRRCYVFTDDAVEGILVAAKNAPGEIVNLSGDESVSVNELAEKMIPEISPGAEIFNTGASWKGDIQILVGDNSKLKSKGFQPRTPLADGIRKLIEWHRNKA